MYLRNFLPLINHSLETRACVRIQTKALKEDVYKRQDKNGVENADFFSSESETDSFKNTNIGKCV